MLFKLASHKGTNMKVHHSVAQTDTHTHTHTHTLTHSLSLSLSLSHAHSLKYTHTHTLSHTLILTHTHSYSLTHSLTGTCYTLLLQVRQGRVVSCRVVCERRCLSNTTRSSNINQAMANKLHWGIATRCLLNHTDWTTDWTNDQSHSCVRTYSTLATK